MAGTTLRYRVCAHRDFYRGSELIRENTVPMDWFRSIGAVMRDEQTSDLSRSEAEAIALRIAQRVAAGPGWRQTHPELE